MKNRPEILTEKYIKSIKKPGRYGDGRGGYGLSLLVKPKSRGGLALSWAQRLGEKVDGKYQIYNIGLGSYRHLSLEAARGIAEKNYKAAKSGHKLQVAMTFEKALRKVIAIQSTGWKDGNKSEKQWCASMEMYVLPKIGDMSLDQITTDDCESILVPKWNEKRTTMKRVKQRMEKVMAWGQAQGYIENNPVTPLDAVLPKNGIHAKHHKAMPYSGVSRALTLISGSKGHWGVKAAFEFLSLTSCRSGEVRLATWNEVDIHERTWTIPGERMKAGRDHRVPLSSSAMKVLEHAHKQTGGKGLIFPGARGKALDSKRNGEAVKETRYRLHP